MMNVLINPALCRIQYHQVRVLEDYHAMDARLEDLGPDFEFRDVVANLSFKGLELEHTTGILSRWVIVHTETVGTDSTEALYWELEPTDETVARHPTLDGWVLTIYSV